MRARAAISASGSGATAQSTEAIPKAAMPARKTRLRPKRSARPLPTSSRPGQGHQERVEHPLQLADAGVQVLGDGRQSDVDDRHVDRADEHRGAHD